MRRVMNLAENLPPESSFRSAIEDRPPVSETSAAVFDLWSLWAEGKPHPRWTALKKQREEAEFKDLLKQKRAAAREHNRIYLQSQKRNIG